MDTPAIGQFIRVGAMEGIVCEAGADGVRVIYLEGKTPIVRKVVCVDEQWNFERPNPDGHYADRYPKYRTLIAQLR